jgi:hypothetical protein
MFVPPGKVASGVGEWPRKAVVTDQQAVDHTTPGVVQSSVDVAGDCDVPVWRVNQY